jgi:tetratricopeptide (TPR) repeat protein
MRMERIILENINLTVQRLRSRACWDEAASLLAPAAKTVSSTALLRASTLVEQCIFALSGWEETDAALTHAEAIASDNEQAGAVASERAFFGYTATLLNGKEQTDQARSAIEAADALLSANSRFRPLMEFRHGLIFENLSKDIARARSSYELAHEGATAIGDELLLSYTWRHLGSVAQQEGDVERARNCYAESLRLREKAGFLIGIAPALMTLASVSGEPEASQMITEAKRLVKSLNGVPTWLAKAFAANE